MLIMFCISSLKNANILNSQQQDEDVKTKKQGNGMTIVPGNLFVRHPWPPWVVDLVSK